MRRKTSQRRIGNQHSERDGEHFGAGAQLHSWKERDRRFAPKPTRGGFEFRALLRFQQPRDAELDLLFGVGFAVRLRAILLIEQILSEERDFFSAE